MELLFSAKLDNPHDMELIKRFFGAKALDEAFADEKNGYQEILNNAAVARQLQKLEASAPPAIRAINERLCLAIEKEAAIKRQTREPEGPEISGVQMDLF